MRKLCIVLLLLFYCSGRVVSIIPNGRIVIVIKSMHMVRNFPKLSVHKGKSKVVVGRHTHMFMSCVVDKHSPPDQLKGLGKLT